MDSKAFYVERMPPCDETAALDERTMKARAGWCEELGDGRARPHTSSPLPERQHVCGTLQHIRSGAFLSLWAWPSERMFTGPVCHVGSGAGQRQGEGGGSAWPR